MFNLEFQELIIIAQEKNHKINYSFDLIYEFIDHNDNFVLWGASNNGIVAKKHLEKRGKNVDFFVDSDPQKKNTLLDNKPVKHPSQIKRFNNKIIICSSYWQSISQQLDIRYKLSFYNDFIVAPHIIECDNNFQNYFRENFIRFLNVFDLLEDEESKKKYYDILKLRLGFNRFDLSAINYAMHRSIYEQYFHPLVKPENSDIIVDGGAYIGDTIHEIIKREVCFSKIYAFEPDNDNFEKLLENSKKIKEVYSINAGLYNKTAKLNFISEGTPASKIEEFNGGIDNITINVNSIDDFFSDKEKPDLIKMDIEGAEKEALIGAKNLIMEYRPKLQICLYHEPSHLCEIPLMIKEWVHDYKLYIGHHTNYLTETVLYAKI